jgi:hypothetical protein
MGASELESRRRETPRYASNRAARTGATTVAPIPSMAPGRFNLRTLLVKPPLERAAAAANRLLPNTQFADDVTVAVRICLLEIVKKAAALAYQHQQTTT